MHCSNCGQETEAGKFCTNCGAQLVTEETAAASDATVNSTPQQPVQQTQTSNPAQTNESVEKLKAAGSNFGQFFMTLLKNPSAAKKANGNDLVSGIITIVIFSLLVALSVYLTLRSMADGIFFEASFMDHFFVPFLSFAIIFGIAAVLTFAGGKVAKLELTINEVIAKYGAYLVPFLLLFVLGVILALVKIPSLPALVLLVSILGPLLLVPTFILFEQKETSVDRLFVLVGLYVVNLLVFGLVLRSMLESLLGTLMGGFLSGFGF